jgi:hypothetical protein
MPKEKKNKAPGRFRQLLRVYRITAKSDPSSAWMALLGFLFAVGTGLLLGFLLNGGSFWGIFLWGLTGVTSGLLVAMIIMSKRAERNAYMRIEGQPGAAGAVLDSQIRRSWRANPMPVAINGKTKDAVYRMVGPAGVVLIAEGNGARLSQMLDDEARKIQRVAPGVTTHKLTLSVDDSGVRLHALLKTVYKLKKTMTRAEVSAVANRLTSLGSGAALPIPKGIDPMKVRAPKRKA